MANDLAEIFGGYSVQSNIKMGMRPTSLTRGTAATKKPLSKGTMPY